MRRVLLCRLELPTEAVAQGKCPDMEAKRPGSSAYTERVRRARNP